MTDRAKAVAAGDLTPRPVVASPDEIGELATTFEAMVAAIGRARAEVVQAERLAAVGRMAAQITHEIRNPISAMGLNAEMLEEELAERPELAESQKLLSAIRGEVQRLADLSERYLGLARKPVPDLALGDVGALVAEVVRFVTPELERAGVTPHVRVDPAAPEVRFDEAQIRAALLNLVRNAREAMPRGGALTIEVTPENGGVRVTVDDEGEGIPEEIRGSLFDPFFTTKQKGTGLGLAVTREILEAHGGSIRCEAGAAKGTRFTLWLPGA